jgi:hypothetical protein
VDRVLRIPRSSRQPQNRYRFAGLVRSSFEIFELTIAPTHTGARPFMTFVDIHNHLLPGVDDGSRSVS